MPFAAGGRFWSLTGAATSGGAQNQGLEGTKRIDRRCPLQLQEGLGPPLEEPNLGEHRTRGLGHAELAP